MIETVVKEFERIKGKGYKIHKDKKSGGVS
jgi:hypothetical protein